MLKLRVPRGWTWNPKMLFCVYQEQYQLTSVNTPSGANDFLNTLFTHYYHCYWNIDTPVWVYHCSNTHHATWSLNSWYVWGKGGMKCQDMNHMNYGLRTQTVHTMLCKNGATCALLCVGTSQLCINVSTHSLYKYAYRKYWNISTMIHVYLYWLVSFLKLY